VAQLSATPVDIILDTSAATIYTVTTGEEHTLTLVMNNITAVDTTVSLWVVKAGDTRSDKHLWVKSYPLYAAETRIIIDRISFPPGTILYAGAGSANVAVVHILGTRKTV
jgi:hypothetical protein